MFITGRSQDRLDDAAAVLGANAVAVLIDVADLGDLDERYKTISAKAGHLHVVVANAALRVVLPFADVTVADFDAIYGVNVRGVFFTVQKALPLLRDGASVVLVGSTASHQGQPGTSLYASAKATLRSFARTWTAELSARRIRVNLDQPWSRRHRFPRMSRTTRISRSRTGPPTRDDRCPTVAADGPSRRTRRCHLACSWLATRAVTSPEPNCSSTADSPRAD